MTWQTENSFAKRGACSSRLKQKHQGRATRNLCQIIIGHMFVFAVPSSFVFPKYDTDKAKLPC